MKFKKFDIKFNIKFNSVKFEISVLYTLILGVILLLFSGVLYLMSDAFFQAIDHELKLKAQQTDRTIRAYEDALGENPNALGIAVQKTISMRGENPFQLRTRKISQDWLVQVKSFDLNKDYIAFTTQSGKTIFWSENLKEELRDIFLEDIQFPGQSNGRVTFRTITYNKKNIRLINRLFVDKKGGVYIIQVGMAQEPIARMLHNWLLSVAVSIPVILFLTNFVGKILASRILAPVQEITQLARTITSQDLSTRIKVKDFDVEMKDLVEAFNDMISRLEGSFKHIEEFSYHAAHELKTPLTIIRGESEFILRRERPPEEYKKSIRVVFEESGRMLKTIEDLLLLTKLDYQPNIFKFTPFDFREFLTEIFEQSRALAARKGIRMALDAPPGEFMINADRLHLRRLFFNIIDNAVKFTPDGGRVDIKMARTDQRIMTVIADTGSGIDPKGLDKIFERFFRIDNSEMGNGLGLNIAQTIAKLHQGRITVESKLGEGSAFTISLPLFNSFLIPA